MTLLYHLFLLAVALAGLGVGAMGIWESNRERRRCENLREAWHAREASLQAQLETAEKAQSIAREASLRLALDDEEKAHRAALATLNHELESLRSRALLAERRLRHEERGTGIYRAGSAAEIRRLNTEFNERTDREENERAENTAQRAG